MREAKPQQNPVPCYSLKVPFFDPKVHVSDSVIEVQTIKILAHA